MVVREQEGMASSGLHVNVRGVRSQRRKVRQKEFFLKKMGETHVWREKRWPLLSHPRLLTWCCSIVREADGWGTVDAVEVVQGRWSRSLRTQYLCKHMSPARFIALYMGNRQWGEQ